MWDSEEIIGTAMGAGCALVMLLIGLAIASVIFAVAWKIFT